METPRRAYLLLLLLNAGVVTLAALTALLLPPPQNWPDWVPEAWWGSAALLSLAVWAWWWLLRRGRGEEAEYERMVAGLSLASLPLLWAVFAVMAFWSGYPAHGAAYAALALAFAVLGYFLQPGP
ncbi:hypothetical protein [Oceanithermus sp.]